MLHRKIFFSLCAMLLINCIAYTQPGSPVRFRDRHVTVDEGAGTLEVTLVRSGASDRALTVLCCTVNGGTARAEWDYHPAKDSVTFAAGATTAVFKVGIIDNAYRDSTRTMLLALASPATDPVNADTMEVEITDNDMASSPNLFVEPSAIDFGDVNIGVEGTKVVMVTNLSANDAMFTHGDVPQGAACGFHITTQPTILLLAQNAKTPIALGLTPPSGSAGTMCHGMIMLRSSAGNALINVAGKSIDTIPPTIQFETPREHDTLFAGATAKMKVHIFDNDSLVDATVEYVIDNSHDHGAITHITGGVDVIAWSVPSALQTEHCHLRVQARDRLGNTATAQSAAFTIKRKEEPR